MNLKVELVKKKQPLRIMTRNPVLENDSRITKIKNDVIYLQVNEEEFKEFKQVEICLVQYHNILFSAKGKVNQDENSIENDDEYKNFLDGKEQQQHEEPLKDNESSTPLLEFIKNRKLKKELYKTPPPKVKKKNQRRKL